jgi:serine/threonine-protein kinase
MTRPRDPLPRRFGRYMLFDKIGEGGMARIYLGREKTELGGERLVVVKQILPMLASSRTFSKLLCDEAKLAAELGHGNIVQVLDLGREESVLYIAMEYVEGFDLRQLLQHCTRSKTPLPTEFSLYIVAQVLRALEHAHTRADEAGTSLGVIHRDVSPSNVLLSFDGEVKLCDFGIARAIGMGEDLFADAVQGKAGYMSPEIAEGQPADERSDVFSAGIILYELLSGRRLYRQEKGSPPSLEQARACMIPELPEAGYPEESRLRSLVMRALAKSPSERYPSARQMLTDLEAYIADTGTFASALRFGQWLAERFGGDIIEVRRARERAAKALERGPLVQIEPLSVPIPMPEPGPEAAEQQVSLGEPSGTEAVVSVTSIPRRAEWLVRVALFLTVLTLVAVLVWYYG